MNEQEEQQWVDRIDAVFLPVRDLEESLAWYQNMFGFALRWKNKRMCGLVIAPNCGFHLVQTPGFEPITNYTPFNYVVRDLEDARSRLLAKGVTVSPLRKGEPKRFDMTDVNGNLISVIEL